MSEPCTARFRAVWVVGRTAQLPTSPRLPAVSRRRRLQDSASAWTAKLRVGRSRSGSSPSRRPNLQRPTGRIRRKCKTRLLPGARARLQEARTEPAGRQIGSTARSLTTENSFQLLFVHLRPALDSSLLGLVAKLVVGPAAGSQVRPQAAAPARRHVVDGRRTRLPGLAVAGTLLVDRPGGDLFGLVFAGATLDQAFLDVLVLALSLVAPRALRHVDFLLRFLPFFLDNARANPFD